MNEIEKMAEILENAIVCNNELIYCEETAKKLINAGYGDVKQAVREFVEKLKKKLIKGDGDDEFTEGYNCACDSHAEEIDKLVKEVCGE